MLFLALSLVLSGCVTTRSSSVDSVIQSYFYDGRMKVTDKYQVTALRSEISDSGTNKKTVGLTLEYTNSDGVINTLFISSEYVDSFRILLKKSEISEGTVDSATTFKLGDYKQVEVVTAFSRSERIISIGSFDGVFAFQEADVDDVLRLLNEIQKESL